MSKPSRLAGAAILAALALAPAAARAEDPKTTQDIRCVVVGTALTQSDDATMQDLGRASLFYFLGRLEGRGETGLTVRITDVAAKMAPDDIKTDSKICGGLFTAAAQSLQDLSASFKDRFGAQPATPAPAPAPPPAGGK
jgi:hypothetical protein